MASWRIRFHDKWPHLASLYASTHNLDEDGKYPDPVMGQDNVFDPSEPYGAYRYYVQPSSRSEFSIEEPGYMHRSMYKDEESRSSDCTSGDSFQRGSTCRVLLCVFLVFSFIGVVVAAITLAVLLSQTPRPLPEKPDHIEEFESVASIYARDYNDQLSDNSTDEFKNLEEEFCKAIMQMFTDSDSPFKNSIAGCEVLEFINGSIQVRYRLKLKSPSPEGFKMETKIQTKLEEFFAKKVNEIGPWQRLKFNPDFLRKFIRIEPPTTPSPPITTPEKTTTTTTRTTTKTTTTKTTTPLPPSSTTSATSTASQQITTESTTPEHTTDVTSKSTVVIETTTEASKLELTSESIDTSSVLPDTSSTVLTTQPTDITTKETTTLAETATPTEEITGVTDQPVEMTTVKVDVSTSEADLATRPSTPLDIITSTSASVDVTELSVTNETKIIVEDTTTIEGLTTEASLEETTTYMYDFLFDNETTVQELPATTAVQTTPESTQTEGISSTPTLIEDISTEAAVTLNISTTSIPKVEDIVTDAKHTEASTEADLPTTTVVTSTKDVIYTTQSEPVQTTVQDMLTEETKRQDITTPVDVTTTQTDITTRTTETSTAVVTEMETSTILHVKTTPIITTDQTTTAFDITATTAVDKTTVKALTNQTDAGIVTEQLDLTTMPIKISTTFDRQTSVMDTTEVSTPEVTTEQKQTQPVSVTKIEETTVTDSATTKTLDTTYMTTETSGIDKPLTTPVETTVTEKSIASTVETTSAEQPIITTEGVMVDADSTTTEDKAIDVPITTTVDAVAQPDPTTTEAVPDVKLSTPGVVDKTIERTEKQTTPLSMTTPLSTEGVSIVSTTELQTPTEEKITSSAPEAVGNGTDIPETVLNVTEGLASVTGKIPLTDTEGYTLNTSEIYMYETTTYYPYYDNFTTEITGPELTTSESQTPVHVRESTEATITDGTVEEKLMTTTVGTTTTEVFVGTTTGIVPTNTTSSVQMDKQNTATTSDATFAQTTVPEGSTTKSTLVTEDTAIITDSVDNKTTEPFVGGLSAAVEVTTSVSSDAPTATTTKEVTETQTVVSTTDLTNQTDKNTTEMLATESMDASSITTTDALSTETPSPKSTDVTQSATSSVTEAEAVATTKDSTKSPFEGTTTQTEPDSQATTPTIAVLNKTVTGDQILTETVTAETYWTTTMDTVYLDSTTLDYTSSETQPAVTGVTESVVKGNDTQFSTTPVAELENATYSETLNQTSVVSKTDLLTTFAPSNETELTTASPTKVSTVITMANESVTTESLANATEANDTITTERLPAKSTKSSEAAFLDEYGEAAFIDEYVPTSVNITAETSVLSTSNGTSQSDTASGTETGISFSKTPQVNVSTSENLTDTSTGDSPVSDEGTLLMPSNETQDASNATVVSSTDSKAASMLDTTTQHISAVTENLMNTTVATSTINQTTSSTSEAGLETENVTETPVTDSVRNESLSTVTEKLTTSFLEAKAVTNESLSNETTILKESTTQIPENVTHTTGQAMTTSPVAEKQPSAEVTSGTDVNGTVSETIIDSSRIIHNVSSESITIQNETLPTISTVKPSNATEGISQNETQVTDATTESPTLYQTSTYLYNTSEYFYNYTGDYLYEYYNVTTELPILKTTETKHAMSNTENKTNIDDLTLRETNATVVDESGVKAGENIPETINPSPDHVTNVTSITV